MEIISIVLISIGALISIVFGVQLLITAFQESILWGLGYIFIPLVSLIFIIVHWQEAKKPFLRGLIGIPFFILGAILAPASH
jgi:F0F1-type ATP synthase assembly protein I